MKIIFYTYYYSSFDGDCLSILDVCSNEKEILDLKYIDKKDFLILNDDLYEVKYKIFDNDRDIVRIIVDHWSKSRLAFREDCKELKTLLEQLG